MSKKQNTNKNDYPMVSVCTPTFNRRPFIPFIIKCFQHQNYPMDKIEWIILDDGTDPIGDLVSNIPQVKYFYYKEKMLLGKKRNLIHSKCKGDIIVYMDDDDYYPPDRISHAVQKLIENPTFLIAGSSEMHVYFESKQMVYQCGPYKDYHSTAATFAFRKELLLQTKFDDSVALAEERQFLKNYTIPLIQLDTLKSILVFSHKHNSLNKEKLLINPESTKTIPSKYFVDDFISDPELIQFYMFNMNNLLENYEPGRPENKPELIQQISRMEKDRFKRLEEQKKLIELQQKINYNLNNSLEFETMRNNYENKMSEKNYLINELLKKIKQLTNELSECKKNC